MYTPYPFSQPPTPFISLEIETDKTQVVLSDMSDPWLSPSDFRKNGMSNAYIRMMNTSGIVFRDHAGSMVRLPPLSSPHPFPHPFA